MGLNARLCRLMLKLMHFGWRLPLVACAHVIVLCRCFTHLMAEVMNNFCKTLDSSDVGVHAGMTCGSQCACVTVIAHRDEACECVVARERSRVVGVLGSQGYVYWHVSCVFVCDKARLRAGLAPQFYSFRWITLLLSQEFELPDGTRVIQCTVMMFVRTVMRLWDSLFADAHRFSYLV
jgi:hypothetical protein